MPYLMHKYCEAVGFALLTLCHSDCHYFLYTVYHRSDCITVCFHLIVGLSFILPMFSSSRMLTRLVNIGLSFLPPYLLMSTAHEALYCLVLCIMLFFWLQAENKLLDTRIHRVWKAPSRGGGNFHNCKSASMLSHSTSQLSACDLKASMV